MKKLITVSLICISTSVHAQTRLTPPDPGPSPDLISINASTLITGSSMPVPQDRKSYAAGLLNTGSKESSIKYPRTKTKFLYTLL